jgi:ankyrin repeat domain-containing protein 50
VDSVSELLTSGSSSEGLAYFYCDRNRDDHQQPLAVLQSIVRQLSMSVAGGAILSIITELYRQRRIKGFAMSELTTQECQDLILKMADVYSQTTIVVDGLDECHQDTRHILMDVLDEIVVEALHPVKVFIASRNDGDLKARYAIGRHLEIRATDNQGDIEQFIMHRISRSPIFREKISPETQVKVVQTFRTKSQGM